MTASISRRKRLAVQWRRSVLGGALVLVGALVAPSALAGSLGMVTPEKWRPHALVGVLDRVTLRVHWYESSKALREAAVVHDVSPVDLHGFSILRRDPDTGGYVCDVFVVRMLGALVDKSRTLTFGHEALHCFGFRHE